MINAVGRDIPEEFLAGGREVYRGPDYRDGTFMQKRGPRIRIAESRGRAKSSLRSARPSSNAASKTA